MDRVRLSLITLGFACIAAGALLLYAAAGAGRWFAIGALTGGALVLGGIGFSAIVQRWLTSNDGAGAVAAADAMKLHQSIARGR